MRQQASGLNRHGSRQRRWRERFRGFRRQGGRRICGLRSLAYICRSRVSNFVNVLLMVWFILSIENGFTEKCGSIPTPILIKLSLKHVSILPIKGQSKLRWTSGAHSDHQGSYKWSPLSLKFPLVYFRICDFLPRRADNFWGFKVLQWSSPPLVFQDSGNKGNFICNSFDQGRFGIAHPSMLCWSESMVDYAVCLPVGLVSRMAPQ